MLLGKSVIVRNFDNIHVVGQPIYKFQNYHDCLHNNSHIQGNDMVVYNQQSDDNVV